MATESLINPFADFGGIVHGERFIGRKEELSKLHQRVLGEAYGNLAIIGLPRIGKSSLAWQGIMENKEALISKKTIPIFFEAGSCSSSDDFFRKMVIFSYEELVLVCENNKFINIAADCMEFLKLKYDKNTIQKYFKVVMKIGFKTIFVIDEFDSVRTFFEKSDFQFLRELSYNPDTHLCLVTCSRKSIEDIEVKDGAISNFAGTFSELRLGMFNDDDINAYWEHFKSWWNTSDKYKSIVVYHSGNHPWLMDWINDRMFRDAMENVFTLTNDNFSQSFQDIKLNLMEALDSIVNTLEKEGLLDAAIQLVIGPWYQVNQKQVEKLLKYGFIRKVDLKHKDLLFEMEIGPRYDNFAYLCFSDYSSLDLYRRYRANVPYFSLWGETENLLRSAIKGFLSSQFSEDWENNFELYLIKNPPSKSFDINRWKDNLKSLKSNKDKLLVDFPCMSDIHLVDFTLTPQIFDIFIRPAKSWFNNHIFMGVWEDWNKKFQFLKKLRVPVAHNNVPQTLEDDIRVAINYCTDISNCIKEWQKRQY